MAYVLDSKGPITIPFTDKNGVTLKYRSDPIDLGDKDMRTSWKIKALQPGRGCCHAEKRRPGCDQPVCDCPGPKQLTSGHFIDMDFMIAKLWLRFQGVKTTKIVEF
jgi:hypothetical protein